MAYAPLMQSVLLNVVTGMVRGKNGVLGTRLNDGILPCDARTYTLDIRHPMQSTYNKLLELIFAVVISMMPV